MTRAINHITFAVRDVEESFSFYTETLGLKPVVKGKSGAYLTAGETWIALNHDRSLRDDIRPDYSHIAFTCVQDEFDRIKARILDYGCIEWSENKSEGDSFYFCDPNGHKLEIHVGDLDSRLESMKADPWDEIQFFK